MKREIITSPLFNTNLTSSPALPLAAPQLRMKTDQVCNILCRKVHKKSEINMFKVHAALYTH